MCHTGLKGFALLLIDAFRQFYQPIYGRLLDRTTESASREFAHDLLGILPPLVGRIRRLLARKESRIVTRMRAFLCPLWSFNADGIHLKPRFLRITAKSAAVRLFGL